MHAPPPRRLLSAPLFLTAPFAASAILLAACGSPPEQGGADTAERSGAGHAAAGAADSVAVREEIRTEVRSLAERPAVQAALRHVRENHDGTVRDQVHLTEIPAPPFGEEERAEEFARMLEEAGADSVFIDEEGNVFGVRSGRGAGRIVVSGHLDTVFPEGTDVTVERRGDTLFAPGIGDDARGLATVLSVLRAMDAADIRTRSEIWFMGTVGEEGLGDLRGVKHLFREGGPRVDAFVSVDGTQLGSIVNRALGSRRYRVTFTGPGGHSWGAFGLGNPAHALGRAIHLFEQRADEFTSRGPRTSYNVGRIGGGTAINAVPYEAWMEVDMRSLEQERLMRIDSTFRSVMDRALEEANEVRRHGDPLEVETELVGDRPSGEVPPSDPLVQRAAATAAHFGADPGLERSSTDSNTPIAAGVPAVTVGGGGEGQGAHSLDEWWLDTGEAYRGVQRVLLLVLGQAGAAGSS